MRKIKLDKKTWDKRQAIFRVKQDRFYLEECGCCGCYHKPGYTKDCRNDAERFSDPADYARKHWAKAIEEAPNIYLRRDIIRVQWKYIGVQWKYVGEGIGGDYNKDCEFDMPLWRFYISMLSESYADGKEIWYYVKDASCCTTLDLDTPKILLQKFAQMILDKVEDNINNGRSIKKICEEFSWIDESWIK